MSKLVKTTVTMEANLVEIQNAIQDRIETCFYLVEENCTGTVEFEQLAVSHARSSLDSKKRLVAMITPIVRAGEHTMIVDVMTADYYNFKDQAVMEQDIQKFIDNTVKAVVERVLLALMFKIAQRG